MSNIAQVPVGVGPPVALIIEVTSPAVAGSLDLTTVTGATLLVKHSYDGSTTTWSATVSNQTQTTCTLTHVFSPSDTPQPGVYLIAAQLVVPGGTVPCYGRPLQVTDPYSS